MYKIPKDLPELAVKWQDWTLSQRVELMKKLMDVEPENRFFATIITMVEQPGKIPNGNCCGLMCQGEKYPWGWNSFYWTIRKPIGFVLVKEGMSGKKAPFLAFADVGDSYRILCEVIKRRAIYDAGRYCTAWVGLNTPRAEIIQTFNLNMRKLLSVLFGKEGI